MDLGEATGTPAEPIAVIGAGIGGLALAGTLATLGVRCRVFEKAQQLSEVGGGTELSPDAVRLLSHLGLGPLLRERAVPIGAMEVRTRGGQLVAGRTYGTAGGATPGLTVHRSHLHAALLSLTDPDRVHLGHRLASVRETPDGALLDFDGGPTLRADLAVGADGVHSAVRAAVHRDVAVASGLVMYRGVFPASALPPEAAHPVVRIWLGPGVHLTCYPVSAGDQVSFAATVALRDRSVDDLGRLAQVFAGWDGLVGAIVEAAGDLRPWPVYDHHWLPTWSSRHVTLLGDAAHAIVPLVAQATSQAIEDAVALASALAEGPTPEDALARYVARRMPRARAIHRSARRAAATLHLPDGPAQWRLFALLTGCNAWPHRFRPYESTSNHDLEMSQNG